MVYAHRIVRRDRAVEKRPRRLASVLLAAALESIRAPPKIKDLPLDRGKVRLGAYFAEISGHKSLVRYFLLVSQGGKII